MIQQPVARALLLCEKVLIEEGSRNISLINTFGTLHGRREPTEAFTFAVYALLADGLGEGELSLVVARLADGAELLTHATRMRFGDRLKERTYLLRIRNMTFPTFGPHQVLLRADGLYVAETRLTVAPLGGPSDE